MIQPDIAGNDTILIYFPMYTKSVMVSFSDPKVPRKRSSRSEEKDILPVSLKTFLTPVKNHALRRISRKGLRDGPVSIIVPGRTDNCTVSEETTKKTKLRENAGKKSLNWTGPK